MKQVLLVDNYDSFTHNLAQGLGEMGANVTVWRNDAFTLEKAIALDPTHVVVSPGPGRPADAGMSRAVIRYFLHRRPILGVCLGHQVLVELLGGTVGRAEAPVHGKQTPIRHDAVDLFAGLPNPMNVGRYHSLVATEVPSSLKITARTTNGEVMAVHLPGRRVYGVQFHPESLLTPDGPHLLHNFLRPPVRIERVTDPGTVVLERLDHIYSTCLPGTPGKTFHRSGTLLLVAWVGDEVVGFKVGSRRERTFESTHGGVLPAFRGQGIARALMVEQHRVLANLLRDGGCIVTHTLNHFRAMLLLNLEEGFVLTAVSRFEGESRPYLRLEKRHSLRPTQAVAERLRTEGPTQVVTVPMAASAVLVDLIREGFDVVGTRITPKGEHALLERASDGSKRFSDPLIQ